MIDRTLMFEDFAGKIGDTFAVNDLPLSLIEAQPLPNRMAPGSRAPFYLIFRAGDPRVLPPQLYLLKHDALGEVTIFLVPVGKDAGGVSYQATFN